MAQSTHPSFREQAKAALAEIEFQGEGIDLWAHEPWCQLILANDWVAPKWSDPAWSAQKKYEWYSVCHAAFENYCEPPEIADVGPTLVRWGNQSASGVVDDILNLSTRWAMCLFEPSAANKVVLDGERLSGRKYQVRHLARADHLLVVAEDAHGPGYALVHCMKDTLGMSVNLDSGLSQATETGQVLFEDVQILKVLGHLPDEDTLQTLHLQTVATFLGRSGALARQLALAEIEINRHELDDLSTRHAELSVELLALQATEGRACAMEAGSEANSIPWSLLQAKGTTLELKTGELLVDTFGYYALPYPDEMTLHNEGAIGSGESLKATKRMLLATEQVNYAHLAGDLYDIAALDLGFAK